MQPTEAWGPALKEYRVGTRHERPGDRPVDPIPTVSTSKSSQGYYNTGFVPPSPKDEPAPFDYPTGQQPSSVLHDVNISNGGIHNAAFEPEVVTTKPVEPAPFGFPTGSHDVNTSNGGIHNAALEPEEITKL